MIFEIKVDFETPCKGVYVIEIFDYKEKLIRGFKYKHGEVDLYICDSNFKGIYDENWEFLMSLAKPLLRELKLNKVLNDL